MEYHERLKLETQIGTLHGLFYYSENECTGWFEEKSMIVVTGKTLNEAIDELLISLDVILDYERRK